MPYQKYLFIIFLFFACGTSRPALYHPRPIDSATAAKTAYKYPSIYLNVGSVTMEKDTTKSANNWVPPKK
jgi:uncharacterized Zn-finger protein